VIAALTHRQVIKIIVQGISMGLQIHTIMNYWGNNSFIRLTQNEVFLNHNLAQ
jgi:hypothetical protein